MVGYASGSLSKAVCSRCWFKIDYTALRQEQDTGLWVCRKCLDQPDPWRNLPPRPPDEVNLHHPRPDESIAVTGTG